MPNGPQMVTYPDTLYYTLAMAAVSIFLFLLGKFFRGKWYAELFVRLALITSSLAISVVVVTAGQFYGLEGDFKEALLDSTVVAVPMFMFGACLRQLIMLNRRDRGL